MKSSKRVSPLKVLLGAACLLGVGWFVWCRKVTDPITASAACKDAWLSMRASDPLLQRCYSDTPPPMIVEMCARSERGEPTLASVESIMLELKGSCA